MQSSSARTLFQSDASLAIGQARATKSKQTSSGAEWGSPIWLARATTAAEGKDDSKANGIEVDHEEGAAADGGRNKVLDMLVSEGSAWVAESGGTVRRVDLESGALISLFQAHRAPCSALTLLTLSSSHQVLITASWDQSIRFFPTSGSSATISTPLCTIPNASSDFVKALHVLRLGTTQVLLSGGSDKLIRAWDLSPLLAAIEAGKTEQLPEPDCIGVSRDHTRPLTCFASLPDQPPSAAPAKDSHDEPVLFSTDSMGRILQFRLNLSLPPSPSKPSIRFELQRELRGCQTGVYSLRSGWRQVEDDERRDLDRAESARKRGATASAEEEDLEVEERSYYRAELWAASNDKTARRFELVDASNVAISESLARGSADVGSSSGASRRTTTAPTALGRFPPLESAKIIEHDDYVKDVLPLDAVFAASLPSSVAPLPSDTVLTSSTDEEIRVWRVPGSTARSAPDEAPDKAELERRAAGLRLSGKASGSTSAKGRIDSTEGVQLLRVVQGHWHEVGRLELWWNQSGALRGNDGEGNAGSRGAWFLVSASLDGSVRRWKLSDILQPKPVRNFSEAATEESAPREGTAISAGEKPAAPADKPPVNPSGMTAEEEAELEELLGSDED